MARSWKALVPLVLLVACSGKPPAAPAASSFPAVVRAGVPLPTAPLEGRVNAPASLLSNNGGGVVSNNGGSYRLAAAEPWLPVRGARVSLVDASRKPLAGIQAVETDAEGRFTIKGAPANRTVVVLAVSGSLQLTCLARAGEARTPSVDPASTLATERVLTRLSNPEALTSLPLGDFATLTSGLQTAMQAAEAPSSLGTSDDAERALDQLIKTRPELAEQVKATEDQVAALPSPEPSATGTPQGTTQPPPTPAKTPVASPSPTPGRNTPATPNASIASPSKPSNTRDPVAGASPDPRNCPGCDFSNANWENLDLTSAKLAGATLKGLKAKNAPFNNADLSNADLTNADLTGANLMGANLSGANLTGVRFINGRLDGINLKTAKLDNANLMGASLIGADLRGITTSPASVTFTNANFTNAKVDAQWLDKLCPTFNLEGCLTKP